MMTLIKLLRDKQTTAKLSDQEFAKQLNIARSLWTQTRNGDRQVGLALIKGTVKAYPELCLDVMNFLREEEE